jgi:AraC-like DNA-binding protein
MTTTLSTNGLERAERFDFWQEIVSRNLLEGECEPQAPQDFFGELVVARTAHVMFAKIRSVAQRFDRTEHHVRASTREHALQLGLQLRGTSVVRQDGRDAKLSPGQFVFLDTARPSTILPLGPFEQMTICLPREALPKALERARDFTARTCRVDTELTGVVVPYLSALPGLLQRMDAPVAERLAGTAVALVVAAIEQMLTNRMPGANWPHLAQLQRAKSFITTHAAETTLTPPAVAAALGISLRALQTLFAEADDTPSDCIWRCRLERARAALASERVESIGTIALISGFSDFAHFSRRFKKAFGMSPGEYRRSKQT